MQRCLAILFIILLSSCSQNKQEKKSNYYHPKVVEAQGYIVPKDSMEEPKVILVNENRFIMQPLSTHKIMEWQNLLMLQSKITIIQKIQSFTLL